MNQATELPSALAEATADQPGARLALSAALASPSHAYLFAGPPGSGKRAAARAFVAELLAAGAEDPPSARRRALADPSPHPDLVWLDPPGTQHLVDTVRERVIAAAAYRPFEGERRAFVIGAAEAMAEESQNALLKTLEEPAPFAHLILITAEPEALLETVRSRCQPVTFVPLSAAALSDRLRERAPDVDDSARVAAARLAGGDMSRALFLLSPEGAELRAAAVAAARAARSGELAETPQAALLAAAEETGKRAGDEARVHAEEVAAEWGDRGPAARRRAREAEEGARRAGRRARTEALDLGLALVAGWTRDLAAVAEGAPELALNADHLEELAADADGLDPRRARRAAEVVMETRRRLTVNVSEQLALDALVYRLESVLAVG